MSRMKSRPASVSTFSATDIANPVSRATPGVPDIGKSAMISKYVAARGAVLHARHVADRRPFRTLAHRLPPYRRGAHRAVQLAVRPSSRRQVPAAHRGHRPRALDRTRDRRDL